MRRRLPLFERLLLELQSHCNRSCFFCNRPWDDSGKRLDAEGKSVRRSMPTERALDLLDQAAALGFRGLVAFHHMSEPFLDPRILDMARAARDRGMRPYEHTNGDVLRRNDAMCREVVGLFEYVVVGLYDRLEPDEVAREKAFWRERLQGTEVRFSRGDEVFPRNDTPFDGRMFREKKTFPGGICRRPIRRLIVHYDGNVALCCEDMKDAFGLGNAFETPIEEIWQSERHRQIVDDLERGLRERYPLCARCPIPPPPARSPVRQVLGRIRRALT